MSTFPETPLEKPVIADVPRARHKFSEGVRLSDDQLAEHIAPFGAKLQWFLAKEYAPHYWQTLFHTLCKNDGRLCRFRNIVAGRRGGKSLSASWEVIFYALHPEHFHWDAHRLLRDKPLHIWVLTENHIIGRQPYLTFKEALKQAGLENGIDYKENKAYKYFEFSNGSLIEFKTADEPERLRGAGLDILWIDEAAVIPTSRAYEVVRPALSDKMGIVICTTTPLGKNWYYDEFWSEEALKDEEVATVEYRSIDNPYFSAEEWQYLKRTYHPLLFKQEYMASFDSMAGKELPGDWLTFYDVSDLPKIRGGDGLERYNLKLYVGIDPAISLSDKADRFAAALIGVTPEGTQAYLLDIYVDRIPFPDQVEFVKNWWMKYTPQAIGIESQVYQRALAQQTSRLEGLPPIMEVPAKGKKSERILSMAPLFKIGKIKIRREHYEFVSEWVDYDSEIKNPKDDCLDAVEICLRTAGVLLPAMFEVRDDFLDKPSYSLQELAEMDRPGSKYYDELDYDYEMGDYW